MTDERGDVGGAAAGEAAPGAGESPEDGEEEVGSLWSELARFVGGLVLIALGLIVSFGVITALIGVPMMVVGYVLYRSSVLSGRRERGVRMDYRGGREGTEDGEGGGRRGGTGDRRRRR